MTDKEIKILRRSFGSGSYLGAALVFLLTAIPFDPVPWYAWVIVGQLFILLSHMTYYREES